MHKRVLYIELDVEYNKIRGNVSKNKASFF